MCNHKHSLGGYAVYFNDASTSCDGFGQGPINNNYSAAYGEARLRQEAARQQNNRYKRKDAYFGKVTPKPGYKREGDEIIPKDISDYSPLEQSLIRLEHFWQWLRS